MRQRYPLPRREVHLTLPRAETPRDWFDRLCHGIASALVDPRPPRTTLSETIVRMISTARRAGAGPDGPE